jgi:hypothetical protein
MKIYDLKTMGIEDMLQAQTDIARMRPISARIEKQNQLLEEARRRDKEAATVGAVEVHDFAVEVSLAALFAGAIFVTQNGWLAVKTSNMGWAGKYECVQLGTGDILSLDGSTRVRPLYIKDMRPSEEEVEAEPEEELARVTGEFDVFSPPAWMFQFVGKLAAATGYRGKLGLILIDHERWPKRVGVTDMTDKPHGFTIIGADGTDTIVLPDNAENTPQWEEVLIHEFIHVLHASVDRVVHEHLHTNASKVAYVKAGEQFLMPFVPLLMIAAQQNLIFEWDEEEETEDVVTP